MIDLFAFKGYHFQIARLSSIQLGMSNLVCTEFLQIKWGHRISSYKTPDFLMWSNRINQSLLILLIVSIGSVYASEFKLWSSFMCLHYSCSNACWTAPVCRVLDLKAACSNAQRRSYITQTFLDLRRCLGERRLDCKWNCNLNALVASENIHHI